MKSTLGWAALVVLGVVVLLIVMALAADISGINPKTMFGNK